jgi:hypothetical protein
VARRAGHHSSGAGERLVLASVTAVVLQTDRTLAAR